MAEKFLTFKRFTDPKAAAKFVKFLKEERIPHQIEDSSPTFDVSFSNNEFEKEVHIKLRGSDFQKVEALLVSEESEISIDDLPEDYYLLEFTNQELMEILIKPDEWSLTDYNLSQKILKSRGKEVDQELLETLRKKRNQELAEPENSAKTWIYAGYIFAILGGLLGIFIGWHLMTFKKTLPDGSRAWGYVKSNRKDGRLILIIGLISTSINVFIWFSENLY